MAAYKDNTLGHALYATEQAGEAAVQGSGKIVLMVEEEPTQPKMFFCTSKNDPCCFSSPVHNVW